MVAAMTPFLHNTLTDAVKLSRPCYDHTYAQVSYAHTQGGWYPIFWYLGLLLSHSLL